MTKKKLNTRRSFAGWNGIERVYSVRDIIRKEMTTKSDLEFLAKKLNIEPFRVTWLKDVDINYRGPQIINLGNPSIGGTHWTATYDGKYFDSFGLAPPQKLEWMEWTPLHLQDINKGFCGNYAILWLYYAIEDELDKFYNLFTPQV